MLAFVAHLWLAATPELVVQTGHSVGIEALAFTADNRFLLSVATNHTVGVWDMASGKLVTMLNAKLTEVTQFGPLYQPTPQGLPRIKVNVTDRTSSILEATVSDGKGGQVVRQMQVRDPNYVERIGAISADGRLAAQAASQSGIYVFDTATQTLRYYFHKLASRMFTAAFSLDGKLLATGGGENGDYGEVRLWDLSTARLQRRFGPYSNIITALVFSPDGRKLYAGISTGQGVIEIDLQTFAERTLDSGPVNSINLSHDGKRMAIAGNTGRENQKAKVLELPSGKTLCEVVGFTAAMSSDGETFAARGFGSDLVFHSVKDCKVIGHASAPEENLTTTTFGRLLSVAEGGVTLIDNQTFKSFTVPSLHGSSTIGGVDVNGDGSLLATGGWDHLAYLWDLKKKKVVHTLRGHSGELREVRFSRDGRTLATLSDDTRVILWDVATGKIKATLIAVPRTDEYVIFTPDGYYTLSRGANAIVAFKLGDRAYPFEQFDLKLNRPDKVLRTLGVATPALIELYADAYAKRLSKLGFTEAQLGDDFRLPVLTLDAQAVPAVTTQASLSVAVRAKDEQHPLDRLLLWVNDVPVRNPTFDLRESKSRTFLGQVPVALSQGRNKIQLAIMNARGVESLKETLLITKEGVQSKPTAYVVAIGVSKYKTPDLNLQYAAKDANDLADVLLANKTRFAEVKVLRLLDEQVTKEAIAAAKSFVAPSRVDDQIVVFVAGHGLLDKHDYYFATHDIDAAQPALRGASYELIEGLVDDVSARQKLLLVDTCNSGEVDDSATFEATAEKVAEGTIKTRGVKLKAVGKSLGLKDSFALQQELFLDLRRGSGAVVISSAGGLEQALESDAWHNGVFTYALLEGLKSRGADKNKDGAMRVSEVRDYVLDKVTTLTHGAQRPTTRRDNLDFDFVVY